MTPAEVLRAARALIATPDRWTQWAYARDVAGRRLDLWDAYDRARAVCWCALGATLQAASNADYGADREPERLLHSACGHSDFAYWNDHPGRTHAEVLAAFDRAIALAEAE